MNVLEKIRQKQAKFAASELKREFPPKKKIKAGAGAAPVKQEKKTPPVPKPRKCCATMKGAAPHLPECQTMQPKKKKPQIRRRFKINFRLPDAAKIEAAYNAKNKKWIGTLTVGEYTDTLTRRGLVMLVCSLGQDFAASHPNLCEFAKEIRPPE